MVIACCLFGMVAGAGFEGEPVAREGERGKKTASRPLWNGPLVSLGLYGRVSLSGLPTGPRIVGWAWLYIQAGSPEWVHAGAIWQVDRALGMSGKAPWLPFV